MTRQHPETREEAFKRQRNQKQEIIEKFKNPDISDDAKVIKEALEVVTTNETYEVSKVIRDRVQSAGAHFRCNNDINEFIKEGELDLLIEEVAGKFQGVLEALVIDTENDWNTQDTANRVAKMFITETMSGRFTQPPKVTAFPNNGYEGLYTSGPISIRSLCAHHFQNIIGKCWVGIIPGEEVIGLSKFNRIVDHIASRPQIQEEMTKQITDAIVEATNAKDIAVIIKAEHHCMVSRGVREHASEMITTDLRGSFKKDDAQRAEFYSLIQNLNSFSS